MIKPIIQNSKSEKTFHCFSITKIEENVLFRKCKSLGMNNIEAHERMKKLCKFLKEQKTKLQSNKNLSDEEVNERFKKSFETLCMKLDGERE